MYASFIFLGGWALHGLAMNLWAHLSESGTDCRHTNDWMLYLQ